MDSAQDINNEPTSFLCVPVLCIVSPYIVGVILFFQRDTANQVCYLATLCKMHVHMLSSEAEHSEAEPPSLLSMSGHMVGVLA